MKTIATHQTQASTLSQTHLLGSLILVFSVLIGCHKSVSSDELTGEWTMTAEGQRLIGLPEDGSTVPTIDLTPDSRFRATAIPGISDSLLARPIELEGGVGSWSLAPKSFGDQFQELTLRFDATVDRPLTISQMLVTRDRLGVVLFQWFGEDGDDRLKYERVRE
jgi:hypothetical protein